MRKSTLAAVAFLIVFPFVYFGREIMTGFGYVGTWPRFGTGILLVVLIPLVAAMLYPLNQRLLAWRKEGGRDIEEEERYETDHGMIRLTENDEWTDRRP